LPKRHAKLTEADLPRLMSTLGAEDPEAEQQALRLLCPCRNRLYDREVWLAIFRAFEGAEHERVRHQAEHAIKTLRDRARADPRSRELLRWLARQGFLLREEPASPRRDRKVTTRDVPDLLDALEGDDPDAKHEALRLLCPCRNRRYDREVWLAIFRAYECAETGSERDQALHAIGTLIERARTDPRSQELLRWLADQEVSSMPLEEAIPAWRPRGELALAGPLIPRWERPRRSRANRRR
jgi:hypothetical protein